MNAGRRRIDPSMRENGTERIDFSAFRVRQSEPLTRTVRRSQSQAPTCQQADSGHTGAIESPILNRFRNMRGRDVVDVRRVCNRSRNFENSMIAAG